MASRTHRRSPAWLVNSILTHARHVFGPLAGFFFFQNFKEQFIAKTNFFSYSLFVFVSAIVGANFSEARVRRNSSPQPLPSAAPERIWEVSRNCISNFAQNGFALNSEYATSWVHPVTKNLLGFAKEIFSL